MILLYFIIFYYIIFYYRQPVVDRTTKPVVHFTHTDSEASLSSNKYGLKTVTVPISIPQRFTELAKPNTLRNMETCGLLFGKLVSGKLVDLYLTFGVNDVISNRLIAKQCY